MKPIMQYIRRTFNSFMRYRGEQIPETNVSGFQQRYIRLICENPGISQEKLAGLLMVNKSSVTRQLALLEQNGFVERKNDERDRRQLLVYPTALAENIYPRIFELNHQWNESLVEGFSEEERELLTAMLERIADRAQKLADDACENKKTGADPS